MTKNPIEGARRAIERNGWTKGIQRNSQGELCLMGALRRAGVRVGTWEEARACTLILSVADEQFPGVIAPYYLKEGTEVRARRRGGVVSFNDSRCRQLDDVKMVLDKAARRWDEMIDA